MFSFSPPSKDWPWVDWPSSQSRTVHQCHLGVTALDPRRSEDCDFLPHHPSLVILVQMKLRRYTISYYIYICYIMMLSDLWHPWSMASFEGVSSLLLRRWCRFFMDTYLNIWQLLVTTNVIVEKSCNRSIYLLPA